MNVDNFLHCSFNCEEAGSGSNEQLAKATTADSGVGDIEKTNFVADLTFSLLKLDMNDGVLQSAAAILPSPDTDYVTGNCSNPPAPSYSNPLNNVPNHVDTENREAHSEEDEVACSADKRKNSAAHNQTPHSLKSTPRGLQQLSGGERSSSSAQS